MDRFNHAIDQMQQQSPYKEVTRKTPDHAGNVLIFLVFAALAILLYVICAAMITSKHEYMNIAGWLGMFTVLGIVAVVFLNMGLIHTVETATGYDWDRDGYIGEPPMTQITFHASERTAWMTELPAPPDLILEWGNAALDGRSLGYRQWKHRFALLPDGSDGEKRYAMFRDALVRSRLATEKGKHGIALTDRGIRQFSEHVYQQPGATPLLEG